MPSTTLIAVASSEVTIEMRSASQNWYSPIDRAELAPRRAHDEGDRGHDQQRGTDRRPAGRAAAASRALVAATAPAPVTA